MNGPIQSSRRHLPDLSRLRKLIGAVCLRRTKRLIGSRLKLSLRIDKKHTVELDVQERRLYDFFKRQVSRLVARNMAANPNTNKELQRNILFLINCLRLICNHGESLLSSVHIMEPQWNPMLEEQSLNRVHRIGQTRDVIVNRYIVSNSIEEVSSSSITTIV